MSNAHVPAVLDRRFRVVDRHNTNDTTVFTVQHRNTRSVYTMVCYSDGVDLVITPNGTIHLADRLVCDPAFAELFEFVASVDW